MAASKNITMIPARKRVGSTVRKDAKPKLRVAAYCRVSTDSDEQASSYEKQVEHYTDFIKANAEWEFAGIYADDGISGTNTKKREEFNRMIEDCMAGRIDMIITKSISRFARNTLDCLKYIRQLKEKYIGDALLQKTYTVDVLTKKRVKNNGIMPQYYVENNHEPIIPRDLYMQVQEEILRRANLHSGANRKKRVYSSKYALSSICYCPRCGDIYQRIKGVQNSQWKCATRVEKGPGACDAPLVPERELQNAVLRGINMMLSGRDDMLTKLKINIEKVLLEEDTATIDSIDARLEELQQELIKRASARQDYENLAEEIDNLREQRLGTMTEKAEREGLKMRIKEMQEFLENQTDRISEYDEQLVRKMIEKITIYDDKFVIEFKSGTSMDVRR